MEKFAIISVDSVAQENHQTSELQLLKLEMIGFCHLELRRDSTFSLCEMGRQVMRLSGKPGSGFTCKKRQYNYPERFCAMTCQTKREMVSFTKSKKNSS